VRARCGPRPAAGAPHRARSRPCHLKIPLARPAKPGEALILRLHADFGGKGVFEPGEDPIVLEHEVKAR
jgi:hypothetical protein